MAATCAVLELAARVALDDRWAAGAQRARPQEALGGHDPDLGWALRADASTTILGGGSAWRATTNARGFRGADIPEARAPGRRRIVVLGDSFSFGWGVDDGRTYADLLAADARLAADVANFAVPGYSTDQQLWTFERHGARLRPDVVVLQFCANDVEGNGSSFAHRRPKPCLVRLVTGEWVVGGRPVRREDPPPARWAAWSEAMSGRSALWAAVSGAVPIVRPRGIPVHPASAGDGTTPPAADGIAGGTVTDILLRRLRDASAAAGARLVVFDATDLAAAEREARSDGDFLTPLSRRLRELGRDAGFDVHSVDRALVDAAARGVDVVLAGDGHWSADGHRVVAESLAGPLARLLAK